MNKEALKTWYCCGFSSMKWAPLQKWGQQADNSDAWRRPQFYIQLVIKSHFQTLILLFGPFGQLRAVRKKINLSFSFESGFFKFSSLKWKGALELLSFLRFTTEWAKKPALIFDNKYKIQLMLTLFSHTGIKLSYVREHLYITKNQGLWSWF